jgi:hypothetical protein
VWRYVLNELDVDLKQYRENKEKIDKAIAGIKTNIMDAEKRIAEKTKEIAHLEKQTTSIQPTIIAINQTLKRFGFDGFSIADAGDGKHYKLVRADGSDAKKTLSEGEKTFVVFLYFYHFINMRTGAREWNCEVSNIDTALLMAGVLPRGAIIPPAVLALRIRNQLQRAVEHAVQLAVFAGGHPMGLPQHERRQARAPHRSAEAPVTHHGVEQVGGAVPESRPPRAGRGRPSAPVSPGVTDLLQGCAIPLCGMNTTIVSGAYLTRKKIVMRLPIMRQYATIDVGAANVAQMQHSIKAISKKRNHSNMLLF